MPKCLPAGSPGLLQNRYCLRVKPLPTDRDGPLSGTIANDQTWPIAVVTKSTSSCQLRLAILCGYDSNSAQIQYTVRIIPRNAAFISTVARGEGRTVRIATDASLTASVDRITRAWVDGRGSGQ